VIRVYDAAGNVIATVAGQRRETEDEDRVHFSHGSYFDDVLRRHDV
jgi:hypothetical protein